MLINLIFESLTHVTCVYCAVAIMILMDPTYMYIVTQYNNPTTPLPVICLLF